MGKVIGVCGFIGSGKGTVGDILVEEYGYEKISFADRLKDAAAVLYGWPRALLEGDTKSSREWREQPDEFWTQELGRETTPRLVLQLMGTDCMRNGFDDNVWVLIVKQQILQHPEKNWVIPDVRFFNERQIIRDLSGEVWRVDRGDPPEWIGKAISDNRYETTWMTDYPDVHESEWRWIDYDSEFNRIVKNDGSVEALHEKVRAMIDGH